MKEVLPVVEFCAGEVWRQGRGPLEVYHLVNAWVEAVRQYEEYGASLTITPAMLIRWGHMTEPDFNPPGTFRRCNVQVGGRACPHYGEVPHLIHRVFNEETLSRMTPEEVYKEFQHIHPFRDGNGRVGKIVYNWLHGTLRQPIMPPDFFGGIRNP